MGRLQGENQVYREMAQNENYQSSSLQSNQQNVQSNPCANQLSEFVACSNKYSDSAMCQQFADALSKCVTINNPQKSTMEQSQFSNTPDTFSFN